MQISKPNEMHEGGDDHDIILNYNEILDEYGISIYDRGTSVISIIYCPWCGSKLPESKRDKWFEQLGEIAYGDELNKIPKEYKSDQWWRKTNNP